MLTRGTGYTTFFFTSTARAKVLYYNYEECGAEKAIMTLMPPDIYNIVTCKFEFSRHLSVPGSSPFYTRPELPYAR